MDTSTSIAIAIGALIGWAMMVGLGSYVAKEKGRSQEEGVTLAILFGPLGVIVAALLPTVERAAVSGEVEATLTYVPDSITYEGNAVLWECASCGKRSKGRRADCGRNSTCPHCKARVVVPPWRSTEGGDPQ